MSDIEPQDAQDGRDQSVLHRSHHDYQNDSELSTSVLMALDSIPGYDIETSDTVVFDHIDLDALDELFRPVAGTPRDARVTFPVDQYEVTVTATGEITIRTVSAGTN